MSHAMLRAAEEIAQRCSSAANSNRRTRILAAMRQRLRSRSNAGCKRGARAKRTQAAAQAASAINTSCSGCKPGQGQAPSKAPQEGQPVCELSLSAAGVGFAQAVGSSAYTASGARIQRRRRATLHTAHLVSAWFWWQYQARARLRYCCGVSTCSSTNNCASRLHGPPATSGHYGPARAQKSGQVVRRSMSW